MITRSAAETHAVLRHLGADTFIGTDFYVHEADLSTSVIKDTRTQILEVPDSGILPLISPGCVPFRSTRNYMTKPTLGETYYFVLPEEKIEMKRIKHIRNASCTGVQCDRQKGREGCSCLHNTNSQSSVYAFDVFFSVPTTLETGGEAMVFGFRSLRTTRLFFTDYEAHANTTTDEEEEACRIANRNKIRAMVEFINGNGGWDIVGWYKMGGATDSATSNNDKVENFEVTIHLSYLFPSKYNANIRQNTQFQTMQIGYIAHQATT